MIEVMGGWGYYNLGDEAILAGYLESIAEKDTFVVRSVDPEQTAAAQRMTIDVRSEYSLARSSSTTCLVAGGGYLNGTWVPEIHAKLLRLNHHARGRDVVAHGVELRELNRFPLRQLSRNLLGDARLAVRDEASAALAERMDMAPPTVMPDGISLLFPHISRYIRPSGIAKGKILVNLLEIGRRLDAHESEVGLSDWREFVEELIRKLGDRALYLIIGGGDRAFVNSFPGLRSIEPRTVEALVSLIAESDGIFSVRMHPALLGTILNRPTVSVPYTGKVAPTLGRIGLDRFLLRALNVEEVLDQLHQSHDSSDLWQAAAAENSRWLDQELLRRS